MDDDREEMIKKILAFFELLTPEQQEAYIEEIKTLMLLEARKAEFEE